MIWNGHFGLARSYPVAILPLFTVVTPDRFYPGFWPRAQLGNPGPEALRSHHRSVQGGGEMAFRAIWVALLLSSLPIAGCGTVANLVCSPPEEGGKSPFGGVRQDVYCIKNGEFGFGTHPKSAPEQHPQVAPMLLSAADLPFSLIGDVVTWPYTVAYSCINQPIPTPPVTQQAPTPPVTQATGGDRRQSSPLETLPEPSKLP